MTPSAVGSEATLFSSLFLAYRTLVIALRSIRLEVPQCIW
jgi:hypothetical protein